MAKAVRPVPAQALEEALAYVRAGGRLITATAYRQTIIDRKTLASFEKAGEWLLKEDGDGYRIRRGKKSDYCLPGILRYVDED